MITVEEAKPNQARICVIGVGGGGGNAVNNMVASGLSGIDFVAANTDAQVLQTALAPVKIQLGPQLTKGLGAGGNPEVGRHAAIEDRDALRHLFDGADMVFITAGMGGGTGTGAAPVVAEIAAECGALTVGVVTKPFMFEGPRRMRQAGDGIAELAKSVDALIVIPNQRLLTIASERTGLKESFKRADDVLLFAVRGISDLITVPGLINLDFADIRSIMAGKGKALMGTGVAKGESRAKEAAQFAISSPLLEEMSIEGATGLLINITGDEGLTLMEVNDAAAMIQREVDEDANIIFGARIDESLQDEVRVTLIATGFGEKKALANGDNVVRLSEFPKKSNSYEEREIGVELRRTHSFDLKEEDELDIPTFLRRQAD